MKKIGLIEDDILLAEQFVAGLEQAGFSVWHARHAGEAIEKIDQDIPDAIVLDMLLPANSGLALVHELQSYADTAAIPVVLCTSLADNLDLKSLGSYGIRRLVDKTTMLPGDLVAAVRAVVL